MSLILAAMSALVFGSADFAGGTASKRNDGIAVTMSSQIIGLAVVLLSVALWPGDVVAGRSDVLWGCIGGVGGGLGLMCFYPALAKGPMSVVAPTTAVVSAVVPVVAGVLLDGAPSWLTSIGIIIALPAIALVAREAAGGDAGVDPRIVGLAIAAGLGFGWFFVALSRASSDSGMWPLAGARVASVLLISLVWWARGRPSLRPAPGTAPLVVTAGALDVVGNALYLLAVRGGVLSWVAVVGSMYPASTVVLARVVLQERLAKAQLLGLGLSAVALALVAVGR